MAFEVEEGSGFTALFKEGLLCVVGSAVENTDTCGRSRGKHSRLKLKNFILRGPGLHTMSSIKHMQKSAQDQGFRL